MRLAAQVSQSVPGNLSLSDNSDRALCRAGTAADALIRIDFKLAVTHADSLNRTCSLTAATTNTTVIDYKCHN
jgi:hypothetical protein